MFSRDIKNEEILPLTLASELCNIVEDDSLNCKNRVFKSSWSVQTAEDMMTFHNLNVETEIRYALIAETVQSFDLELMNLFVKNNNNETIIIDVEQDIFSIAEANISKKFEKLVDLLHKHALKRFENTENLALIVSPMIISILQSAAKSSFAPSNAGTFKGPNNTMLVGHLTCGNDKEEITFDVYSYLWHYNVKAKSDNILMVKKGLSEATISPDFFVLEKSKTVVNEDVEDSEEQTEVNALSAYLQYDVNINPNSIVHFELTNLDFN